MTSLGSAAGGLRRGEGEMAWGRRAVPMTRRSLLGASRTAANTRRREKGTTATPPIWGTHGWSDATQNSLPIWRPDAAEVGASGGRSLASDDCTVLIFERVCGREEIRWEAKLYFGERNQNLDHFISPLWSNGLECFLRGLLKFRSKFRDHPFGFRSKL
jgi:hypothetical protein